MHYPGPSPTSDLRLEPRFTALAAFSGWLPLVVINGFFVRRVNLQLDFLQSVLHHLYDAGHLLGLAIASWLLVAFLWRLPVYSRIVVGFVVVGAVHYGLLAGDLQSFIARHSDVNLPWHLLFTLATTLSFMAAVVFGYLTARNVLCYANLSVGIAIGVGNHLVLPGNYPGIHFILAWTAAGLIGTCAIRWVNRLSQQRVLGLVFVAVGALCTFSYVVPPGRVVRRALLGSEGSVASPYLARLWTRLAGPAAPAIRKDNSPWFSPRLDLPPVPPDKLPGAPERPVVVLLTLDALRSDIVEETSTRDKVPSMRAMSRHALTFQRVWSPAAYTMASLRGLFLGTYYLQHPGRGAEKLRRKAGHKRRVPRTPFVAELLEDNGVTTVSLRTRAIFSRKKGICRGFGEEIDIGNGAPSEKVVERVLRRLDEAQGGPLFIYSHIFDLHSPYNRGGTHGSAKHRYIAEASVLDKAIGTLRQGLQKRGLMQTTYLIITSDHGEAFGEHGHEHHGTTLYEEMIRIPLFIEGPGVKPRRVSRSVSLVDLGPTILSLFGVATPGNYMGQSLVPFMSGADPILERPLAADGGRAIRAMLFEDRWKAIVDENLGTEELYDLQEDPAERRNLTEEPYAAAYFSTLRAFFAGLNR